MLNGLEPDIVVCYDGANEIFGLRFESQSFRHSREDQIRKVMKGQDRREDILSFKALFVRLEMFIEKMKEKYSDEDKSSPGQRYDLSEERFERVANDLLKSWLCTKDLAERNGAHFVAFLQPIAALGKPVLEHLELDADNLNRYRTLYATVLKLLQLPKYQELSRNVMVLTDALDRDEYIYIDFCHVSPNGIRIIDQKIYDHVIDSLGNE